jgi:hypothetical protein
MWGEGRPRVASMQAIAEIACGTRNAAGDRNPHSIIAP